MAKDYLGIENKVLNLVLAIIPVTCWILGVITRFKEGKIVAGIIRIFLTAPVIWILDIIWMVTKGSICRVLDI